MPFPDLAELAADIPFYRQAGVVGLFLQGDYSPGGGGESAELRSYVMARLLWDTKADPRKARDEFLEGVYRRAAAPMKAYYDLLQARVRTRHLYIYQNPGAAYLSGDFLERGEKLLARAEALAETEGARRRVKKDRLSLEYVGLSRASRYEVNGDRYAPRAPEALRERLQRLLAGARSFGMTHLSEHGSVEMAEAAVADRFRSYGVVRLENRRWRVDVVPELNGRIVRMLDRSTGRNVLYVADPGERGYPDTGGQALLVSGDFHSWVPYKVRWKVEVRTAGSVELLGTSGAGLRIWRRISFGLGGAAVETEAVARNDSAKPLDVTLEARFEAGTGGLEGARIAFPRADGTDFAGRLMLPGKEPLGREEYRDASLPRREWRLEKAGRRWVARFDANQLDRVRVDWADREVQGVRLGLWSKKVRLEPGASVRLNAEFGYRDSTRVE